MVVPTGTRSDRMGVISLEAEMIGCSRLAVLMLSGFLVVPGTTFAAADVTPTDCTSCTPPGGAVGYTWYKLKDKVTFTCLLRGQTIKQSYNSALAGFRQDGRVGIIRFTEGSITQEMTIPDDALCTLRFPA